MKYSDIKNASRLIDEAQWDGSDFFMVWPLPRFVFVTQRVVDCIRDHRLQGVVPQPTSEIEPTTYNSGYAPGRLSHCMPEVRARELGKADGIVEI